MSFNNHNPLTPITTLGNLSVPNNAVFGTNFSILSTGGYMEVYNLSDLNYIIPPLTTGLIQYSANTIPIQFNKGTGSLFSYDVLTLNSDNISSGRRKLGMMVYVISQNEFYQYTVPNFEALWNAATGATGPGGATVVFSVFGTTVKNNTVAGTNFINGWTGSTIEGVSGGTSTNSNWVIVDFNSNFFSAITACTFVKTNKVISCSGDSEIILSSGETIFNTNINPLVDATIDIGNPLKRFRDINTVSGTTSYWSATTVVYTPLLDLGLDSNSELRQITANNSVIQNDVLNGGSF